MSQMIYKPCVFTALFSVACMTLATAKRAAPEKVAPVSRDGIEYCAPRSADKVGRVQARDAESKKVLWEATIYEIEYDPDLEKDVQWIFISGPNIEGESLIITDERNKRYALDLKTREVHELNWLKPRKKTGKASQYPSSIPKPTLSEVRYGEHERHVLDFWRAESDQPTPLVFVIHGGGWQNGSKERLNRFVDAAALLKEGISVVAINYRYTKNAGDLRPPVKAPLYDAARALQLVRSKADEWNIDKKRIGAAGASAGACSSLWLLYHDDLADPESEDPIARESTRLYCAAVNNAQTTLDPKQMKEWTPNSKYGAHAFGLGDFEQFLAERENILPWIEEYSPYALVSADDPPVYLCYKGAAPSIGKPQKDPTHTSNFGLKLQERCVELGLKCELMYSGAANVKHKDSTTYLSATLKAPAEETCK